MTETATKTNTEAAVECVNMTHTRANELAVSLRAAFAPLVGKKILKADGTLVQKFADLVPLGYRDGLQVYLWRSGHTTGLDVMVKGCVVGKHANYHETCVRVGSVDATGALLALNDADTTRRTDWTVAAVERARQALEDADTASREAKSALGPFNRHEYNQ